MVPPETPEPLVWYAAYGSNLSYARFMTYLAGGTPEGRSEPQAGAGDPSPPRASRPFRASHALHFAGDAPSWGGGGVAFLHQEPEPGALTYARAYLITVDQLRDVLAQENGLAPERGAGLVTTGDLIGAAPGSRIETGAGEYGLLLCLGREPVKPGGPEAPVWTFTTPHPLEGQGRQPSDAYLSTICRGLLETFWALPLSEVLDEEGDPSPALSATPDAAGGLDEDRLPLGTLERYLCDRLNGDSARIRDRLAAQKVALVEARLRDGANRLAQTGRGIVRSAGATRDRRGAGKAFIAQLSETDLRTLRLRGRWPLRRRAQWVILESVHPRKRVTVRARVHRPADDSKGPEPGQVQMDQKLRQGLGIQRGDPVLVRAPTRQERRLREHRRWPSRLARWILRACGRVQPQLMRVTLARYEEMEIRVCRIPADGFDVLGLEPGGFVTIESATARMTLRGLEATDAMVRDWRLLARDWARVPECHEELDLERVSPDPDRDLPLILIDLDAREELSVKPCDVVAVYRDLPRLLWRQLRALGLTFILSASIVIFQLTDLSTPAKFAWFGGAVVFGLLLVLYEIRKQLD